MTYGLGLRTRALSLAADHEEAGRTQTADVLTHLAQENDNLREALRRLQRWGGIAGGSFSGTVAGAVVDWFDAGGAGPLPDLPGFARREPPNVEVTGKPPCGAAGAK